jgi:undecaprenyl-diphosphatase
MQKVSASKIDLQIFTLINGFAKKSRILDFFGIFCAIYLGYSLIFTLAIISHAVGNISMLFLPLASGAVSVIFINEVIYIFWQRKRPMEQMRENALIQKPFSPAFPSSHTSFFFALSFALFLFNTSLACIFLALSFVIAIARIFCGVHWPSDIIGGILSAIISFLIILTILSVW